MFEKVILVSRKTRLEGLIERFNTRAQARFYIEHSGGHFDLYEREHEVYYASLRELRSQLANTVKTQEIERTYLPAFLFSETDLVVTVGIDGLVVNTAKYLDGQPLVAVNPDPAHIDGVLLPFTVKQAVKAVHGVFQGQMHVREISMAEARLNDGQRLLAFNDLFVGVRSHMSARYRIEHHGRQEDQSSSGIIISTGAGSTGWLSSLFNMANGMWAFFSRESERLSQPRLDWGADRLLFVVREPFVSKTSGADVVCGTISDDDALHLESHIPQGGVIFSDGVEADFLEFNAGVQASIGLSEKKTRLVVRSPD